MRRDAAAAVVVVVVGVTQDCSVKEVMVNRSTATSHETAQRVLGKPHHTQTKCQTGSPRDSATQRNSLFHFQK